MNLDSGRGPSSQLSLCVPETGMVPEAATPPFHCTMRPEAGICSFLIPTHAQRRFQAQDRVTPKPKPRSRCAHWQSGVGFSMTGTEHVENTFCYILQTYSQTNNIQYININYLHKTHQYDL